MALGRSMEFDCGSENVAAVLAVPAFGRGPGVLVVPSAYGLVDVARDACERLAREGFVALAPDLFRGETTADRDEAIGRAHALDFERCRVILDAAVNRLLSEHAVDGSRVAALGFGAGGQLAIDVAARNDRVGAVVSLDGAPTPADLAAVALDALEGPVLVVVGEKDAVVADGSARALEASLRDAGVSCRLSVQPGAAGDFMDPVQADVFDAVAAAASWDAALALLRGEI